MCFAQFGHVGNVPHGPSSCKAASWPRRPTYLAHESPLEVLIPSEKSIDRTSPSTSMQRDALQKKVCPMSSSRKPRSIRDGEITILEFGEELEILSEDVMPAVAKAVQEAGEAEVPQVLLDLSGVKFFGSSFIEVLYRLWKQMESRQGRFVLSGLHPFCREVLQVTNLDKLWTIAPDRESGLALLRTGPAKP